MSKKKSSKEISDETSDKKTSKRETSKRETSKRETSKKEANTSESGETSAVKVYKYSEIKFSNAEVSELNKSGTQHMAYINYNDSKLSTRNKILIQSGHIELTSHGIPPLDKKDAVKKYYPDNKSREFIKIPLDPKQPTCDELRKHLEAADKWAGTEEMRRKLFGSKWKKYVYSPSIKVPKSGDDDDDGGEDEEDESKKKKKKSKDKDESKPRVRIGKDGKEYPIMDYVKMKFNIIPVKKDDKEDRIIKTKIKKVLDKKK